MRQFKRMAIAATVLGTLLSAGNVWAQTWNTTGNNVGVNDFLGTTNASDIIIKTNNTERARITSGGDIGVGTTTPGRRLHIHIGSVTPQFRIGENATNVWDFWGGKEFHITEVGGNDDWLFFSPAAYLNIFTLGPNQEVYADLGGGTSRFGFGLTNPYTRLTVAGNVIPSSDNTFDLGSSTRRWDFIWAVNTPINTSDARLKENVQDLHYGLNTVMQLHPVSFNWKEEQNDHKTLGLIAQELMTVVPEVVRGGENGELFGVYYSDLIPVLIKAVQEQRGEIATRAAANTELREQVAARAERIRRLEEAVLNAQSKSDEGTDAAE